MGANELSRREFLKVTAAAGGFALSAGWTQVFGQEKFGPDSMPNGAVDNPLVFVSIAPNGIVTITCHRAEMGQGVRTGMPMIVADELEADWSKVRVVQAPGDELRFGNQDTDGSRTTRHFFMPMRRCGAAARAMLEAAAAARWGVPASEVEARNHELVHRASGRKLGFGAVAADAAEASGAEARRAPPEEAREFRYIGKGRTRIVDAMAMTTGRAVYGQDVVLPDMHFAVVARAPVYGGKVVSFDAAAAMKVPGVVKVVEIKDTAIPSAFQPLAGVAVIAQNTWAAMKGREALSIKWDDGANATYDSDAYRAALTKAATGPGKQIRSQPAMSTRR